MPPPGALRERCLVGSLRDFDMKSLLRSGCIRLATAIAFSLSLQLAVQRAEASATAQHATAASTPSLGGEYPTTPPSGFTHFRLHFPDEVRDSAPAYATPAQVELARQINAAVNKRITWRTTRLWSVELKEPAYGDCVSFALTARHELRTRGVPDGAMRLMIVYAGEHQEKHMVLQMRTQGHVFVLDSLPNKAGKHFYELAAMPASYVVLQFQMWGRPTQWLAPSAVVAEKLRANRGRIASENGALWVHGLEDRPSRSRQDLAARRQRRY